MSRISRCLVTLAALTGVAVLAPAVFISRITSAGATTEPVCTAPALTMTVGIGRGAAGNLGFPVLITNHGSKSCLLDGFPTVTAHTGAVSPHLVIFVHTSRSQIYATAKAKPVVVAPEGRASFGVSYVDNLDQQYGEVPRCVMNSISVRLPGVTPLSMTTISFVANRATYKGAINSCWAGFEFGLTPIVKGSEPPHS